MTIVTPSYNQGSFIRATIESVLSQDYPNLEYIIMDGGSTDETANVVKDYASRLTWISEKDRGQSHAINKGFRLAKGEILSWLNSDDILLPGAVSTAVRAFRADPDIHAVYGEGYLIDRDGNITGRFPHTQPFDLWKLVYLSDYIMQQTLFFRKPVLDEIGYLDESLHYVMDWDFLIRIGKRYGLTYLQAPMACLREHANAKTTTGGMRRLREIRDLLRRHTKRPFPPGYLLYLFDHIRTTCLDRMLSGRPPLRLRLIRPIFQAVVRGTEIGSYVLLRHSQGRFADGWAAPRTTVLLPVPEDRELHLTFTLPPCPIDRQRITVFLNGTLLARCTFGVGRHNYVIRVPPCMRSVPLEVRLCAARSFSVLRPIAQARRLAYILERVSLVRGGPSRASDFSVSQTRGRVGDFETLEGGHRS